VNERLENNKIERQTVGETPREYQILASVGPAEHFAAGAGWMEKHAIAAKRLFAEPVDWISKPDAHDAHGQLHNKEKNEGDGVYIMSGINSNNKVSEGYAMCTGLVVAGVGPGGKNISLMTHQNPDAVLQSRRNSFPDSLRARLREMRELTREGTVSAVIFAGALDSGDSPQWIQGYVAHAYRSSVQFLQKEIADTLGVQAQVVESPNLAFADSTETVDVFFENDRRRLHVMRRA